MKGESVDNFNWGVRRPSLSHLDRGGSAGGIDEAELPHLEGHDQATPVLMPKREATSAASSGRPETGESSDDEMGSVSTRWLRGNNR